MTGLPFDAETTGETSHLHGVQAHFLQGSGTLTSGGWLQASVEGSDEILIGDSDGATRQDDAAAHLKNDMYILASGFYTTTQGG